MAPRATRSALPRVEELSHLPFLRGDGQGKQGERCAQGRRLQRSEAGAPIYLYVHVVEAACLARAERDTEKAHEFLTTMAATAKEKEKETHSWIN